MFSSVSRKQPHTNLIHDEFHHGGNIEADLPCFRDKMTIKSDVDNKMKNKTDLN